MRHISIFRVLFLGLILSACAGALNDFEAGKAAKNRGDYDQAIMLYSRAIDSGELSPLEMAVVYNNRAFAYGEMYSYDQAIADYTRALKLQPDYISAYKLRGNAYDGKGLREQAKADREKARQLEAR